MAIDAQLKEKAYEKRIASRKSEIENKLASGEIEDAKLVRLYSELLETEDENYQKVLKSYIDKYTLLTRKSGKLSESQAQGIDELNKAFKSLESQNLKMEEAARATRQKGQALDPTSFISEFGAGFKSSMKQGRGIFGSLRGGVSSSASQLKESGKSLSSIKNLSKSLLHVAGVVTDLPALNILASEMGGDDTNVRESEANRKLIDLLDSDKSEKNVGSSDAQKGVKNERTGSSESVTTVEDKNVSTTQLDSMNVNSDSVTVTDKLSEGLDVGGETSNISPLDYLEHIEENTFDISRTLKSYIKMRKDWRDDSLFSSSGAISESEAGVDGPASKLDKANPLDDLGMLGGMFGMGGGKDGKASAKGGRKSRFPKMGNLAKVGNFAKGFASKVALPLTVAFAAYDAFKGVGEANEVYGLEEGQEATIAQKSASAFGSVLETISFGLIENTEKTGDAITNFVRDWTPIGIVASKLSDLFTDDDSDELVGKLEKEKIVDTSFFGKSKIRDFDAIENLSAKQIDAIIRYDDWDDETVSRLEKLRSEKESAKGVKGASIQPSDTSANVEASPRMTPEPDMDTLPRAQATAATEVEIEERPSQESQPRESRTEVVPVQSGPAPSQKTIDNYNLEDDNLVTLLRTKGLSSL